MIRKIYLIIGILFLAVWPFELAETAFIPHELFEHTGNGIITIFNIHSGEFETVRYKNGPGAYLKNGINELNYLLRCRLTDRETDMSVALIELVDKIEDHFGVGRVEVISGYRSPELNRSLRGGGRGVAGHSLHMRGLAIDIKIPGVPLNVLRDYAKSLRAGGVGYYSGKFVHVDVGSVRYW